MLRLRCTAALLIRAVPTLLALALGLHPGSVTAHEVRPGYLELREVAVDTYGVIWKVPAKGEMRLGLYVSLPPDCVGSEPVGRLTEGAHLERWRTTCAGGLVDKRVTIDGLPETRTDVLVRVERADGTTQTVRLTPDSPSFVVAASPSWLDVARTYLVLGFEHILLGADHLLFVLVLLFLVGSFGRLVATVTAFTLAHSLTLGAATLGWLRVPQAPVEATIALSVVFAAAEVVRGGDSLTRRKPWLVAFLFGLLHGLGFAGALHEVGLPDQAVPLALLFFNVGVELGQLTFVAAVFACFAAARPFLARSRHGTEVVTWDAASLVAKPLAYAIGVLATFWLVERAVGFWGI